MVYQLVRPTTLLEVISDAGGISDDAGSIIIVTRGSQSPLTRWLVRARETYRSPIRKSLRFACRI